METHAVGNFVDVLSEGSQYFHKVIVQTRISARDFKKAVLVESHVRSHAVVSHCKL